MADEPLERWAATFGGRRLVQPDQRSCGAAVLAVAQALADPAYVELLATPEGFRSEVLALHRRVTSAADVSGRAQLPWPQALGTPPWAIARQLAGTSGVPHRMALAWPDRGRAFDEVVAATRAGRPVPFYVGSRWLPRHVVLALGEAGGRLRCYEPASGGPAEVDRAAYTGGRLGLGGWDVPWFSVLPSGRRTPA